MEIMAVPGAVRRPAALYREIDAFIESGGARNPAISVPW
jgi:hypothetical protein